MSAMWEFTTLDRYSDRVCQRGKQEMALETAKIIATGSHREVDIHAWVGLALVSPRPCSLVETATTRPMAVMIKP